MSGTEEKKPKQSKEENTEESQEIRAKLRANFIKTLSGLKDRKAEISLHGNSKPVTGTFQVSDRDNLHFGFTDFTAPNFTKYKSVLVRTTDIVKVEFKDT